MAALDELVVRGMFHVGSLLRGLYCMNPHIECTSEPMETMSEAANLETTQTVLDKQARAVPSA